MARHLGVTPQAVNEWKKGKRPLPLERCPDVERATNGVVTRKDLRPDDWQRIWPELANETPKRRKSDRADPPTTRLRRKGDLPLKRATDALNVKP
jgi:DNA-binding transcriptional regulator YdaS (Cro superfamily)